MGASAAVYATIEKLVRALLDQLISHILGGEVPKIDRKKKQKVRIAYNFVGEIQVTTK
ncbi:DUF4368 domain-containing protein [Gemmiger formicilis]|uniref:DUF4368 domain-containing protein n=1 Tax=Anaerotruncus colihominis TaxID=169435 RepID=A0A3E3IGG0_9FIRM|nr:DUF4368 domain-containing protein [Blautia faecis]MBS6218359.1 DUF4368 domain-containing protein [Clostridiales bacterium]RGE66168.1 DUF4368 domain-containing protein [Anaerotruncus colihominis]